MADYLTFEELKALEDMAISGDKNALHILDSMAREEGYESWEKLNEELWKQWEQDPNRQKMHEAIKKEKERRRTTPGVLQVWEYLRRMSQSVNLLEQAIGDSILYRDIYKIAKKFQEKSAMPAPGSSATTWILWNDEHKIKTGKKKTYKELAQLSHLKAETLKTARHRLKIKK